MDILHLPLNTSSVPPAGGDYIDDSNIEKLDIEDIIVARGDLTLTENDECDIITLNTPPKFCKMVLYRRIYTYKEKDSILDIALMGCHSSWYEVFRRSYTSLEITSNALSHIPENSIVPHRSNIFRAFNLCHFDKVKVIIIGQGPYPWLDDRKAVANGLAFSTFKGGRIESSLYNIYKELRDEYKDSDTPFVIPSHGDISSWAEQGVLLLNATLTGLVRKRGTSGTGPNKEPHEGKWNSFLKHVLDDITRYHQNLIFVLWGRNAQSIIEQLKIQGKHHMLKSAHPSGFARDARDKFQGCGHFKAINELLIQYEKTPINWTIED